jgi:hypothetical protein
MQPDPWTLVSIVIIQILTLHGTYILLQSSYFDPQQNMLQDTVRTSTYRNAILLNTECFEDKLVMDVGAGTLSKQTTRCIAGKKGDRKGA